MLPATESVPVALREHDQWVCWREQGRDGKPTKVPVNPQTATFASVADAETWADFETARAAAEASAQIAGVGFVFTDQDGFVGVDLDDCRDAANGRPEPWAKEIVSQLDSYTEVSPSGTGYHVYLRGVLPPGGNRSGNVELYDAARFFTVTGDHVRGTPTSVHERAAELRAVHSEHVSTARDSVGESESEPTSAVDLSDEDLLARARAAKNGAKFSRLWRGDTSGYDSHSEADMALCCLLAFWTGGDETRVDRLFRQSGLLREKWDETHYASGDTYGERTVSRAVETTDEFYDPATAREAEGDEGSERRNQPGTGRPSTGGSELASLRADIESLETAVAELRTRSTEVTTLTSTVAQLRAENEYLHDSLASEQAKRKRVQRRLDTVEGELRALQEHWLFRRVLPTSRE